MADFEIPKEIAEASLGDWYAGLTDPERVKVRRYLPGIDTSSQTAFITDLMSKATEDHNYRLAVLIGTYAMGLQTDDYTRFKLTEGYIEGLYGAQMYAEAKEACCRNLDLYPVVSKQYLEENGGELPKHMSCRNRLIDISIGVFGEYDMADPILTRYVEMGLIDEEEKGYRLRSIKIYRMQRTFDGIFNFQSKQ